MLITLAGAAAYKLHYQRVPIVCQVFFCFVVYCARTKSIPRRMSTAIGMSTRFEIRFRAAICLADT